MLRIVHSQKRKIVSQTSEKDSSHDHTDQIFSTFHTKPKKRFHRKKSEPEVFVANYTGLVQTSMIQFLSYEMFLAFVWNVEMSCREGFASVFRELNLFRFHCSFRQFNSFESFFTSPNLFGWFRKKPFFLECTVNPDVV